MPTLTELVDSADDELFAKVLGFFYHVLRNTLHNETVSFYGLRWRRHNEKLACKTSRLLQFSFIVRMLYTDIY